MKQEKIFIDSGAWIALLNSRDQYHEIASNYFHNLSPSVLRVTSSHVISETYTWLRYKTTFQHATKFLDVIRQACHSNQLSLVVDHPDILDQAEQLLRDFSDQKISYVDAVSMSIMLSQNIKKVFAFDQHFYLMKFEILPA